MPIGSMAFRVPIMHRTLLALVLALGCTHTTQKVDDPSARAVRLQTALTTIAKENAGTIAVSVTHLSTGAHASINGSARLPMMSVFKLPLAIVTLAAIDDGKRTLDEVVPISEHEIRSTFSPIADAWKKGDKSPTLRTILERVIQDSDNTAGDKLVTLNGGGAAVTAKLRSMGIEGVDIAEEEIDIAGRIECTSPRPPEGWSESTLGACTKTSPEARLEAAKRECDHAPNGATPDALVAMLTKLDRGEILSKASRAFLLQLLEGTRTGLHRIKAELPPGTRVGHKTGTGSDADVEIATNDVGIVWLPDGSRFAIAIMSSRNHGKLAAHEAVIAKTARAAWDAFVP